MLKQADKEGNPYAAIHLNEEEHIHLLDQQEGKDFYVPTEKEITELVELGYIRTPAMTALEVHVKSLGGDPSLLQPCGRWFLQINWMSWNPFTMRWIMLFLIAALLLWKLYRGC